MKQPIQLLLAAITLLGLPAGVNAVTLTNAQVTFIVKDVKTIDPAKGVRAAIVKETVSGDQGVRTGLASRTELLFNDKSITRLGANTHFSFSEGTRDLSLQSGVMLLQVPKGIGGAKIETSAVTAGITGTTIMLDAGKKYTKLIVLEGNCYLIAKSDKGRFPRKVWAHAGQEIIFLNGSGKIPDPVYINLKLIEATSLLLNGRWGVHLDYRPINAAANGQRPEDYTDSGAGGAGADGVTTIGKLPQNPGSQAAPPPPPPPPPPPRRGLP